VEDLRIWQTKPRDPGGRRPAGDGHWGVQNGGSVDVLVHNFDIQPNLLHCVGSDGFGMYAVFSQGNMANGNLELHRWAGGDCAGEGGGGGPCCRCRGRLCCGEEPRGPGAAERLDAGEAVISATEP
jgi:hypothetical protein